MYMYVHVCTCMYMYVHVCICMFLLYVCVNVYVCVYVHVLSVLNPCGWVEPPGWGIAIDQRSLDKPIVTWHTHTYSYSPIGLPIHKR